MDMIKCLAIYLDMIRDDILDSVSGATYQYYNDNFTFFYYYIPSSIKSVTITGGNIPSYAFHNCSGLTSVTIPDSVTSIDRDAFRGCSKLKIYCEAISKPSGWNGGWNSGNRPVIWGVKK